MSYFDDASLAFLPSGAAGKDGKAYSIKPTDGTGDFTFSRGSNLAATRVDAAGLIEKGRENLLLQSNQFDTTWLQNRIDLTSGQSGYDGGSDAWKLESNNASTTYLAQSVVGSGVQTASAYAKAGTANYLTFYNSSGASVWFNLSNGSLGNTNLNIDTKIEAVGSDGWYRCSMTFNVATSYLRVYVTDVNGSFPSAIGANILIQDAQLEVGLAATDVIETTTTTGTAGILENTPRFDYSNGASCPSLLLEPSRTQLIPQSEYFDYWTQNEVSLDFGYLAPDGTSSAYKITKNGTQSYLLIPGISAQNDSRSIYARTTSGTGQVNLTSHSSNSNSLFTITEEWQRFEITSTPSVAGNYYAVDFRAGNLNEVIIWGAQLESASYPTSYIPNHSGGTITRAADVCVGAGDVNTFNSTEGVLYAEIAALADDGTFRLISLSDGTNNNTIKIGYRSNSNAIYFEIRSSGASQSFYFYTTTGITNFHKVAVSYKDNDFALWIDGTEVYNDTSGIVPLGLNELSFDNGANNDNFYGNVKQVVAFPIALTDSELTELTINGLKEDIIAKYKAASTFLEPGADDRLDTYLQSLEDFIIV